MSEIKVELDKKAVKKLILQADFTQKECERVAQSKCGSNGHIKSFIGFDRARAIVYPNTKEHKG